MSDEMSYDEYEKKCEEIQIKNEVYLEEFADDLVNAGLKDKTINKHLGNVDFYINNFLLREDALDMKSGTYYFYLTDFFGYFFIRKCMWSTPSTIKSTAASFKKFYKSMLKRGHIDESNYDELIDAIKENMDSWLADCKAYNDPNAPNPFDFFSIFED